MYTCECPSVTLCGDTAVTYPAYQGSNCETDTNECAEFPPNPTTHLATPCNSGACVNTVGSFYCNCTPPDAFGGRAGDCCAVCVPPPLDLNSFD